MEIDKLRKRIAVKLLIAQALGSFHGFKFLCEISVDCMRLCNAKMESFIATGASKEDYNTLIDTFRETIDAAMNVAKTARTGDHKNTANAMAADIAMLALELKLLASQVTIIDAPKKEAQTETTPQQEVDAILDKVSRQGITSLSPTELEKLKNFK